MESSAKGTSQGFELLAAVSSATKRPMPENLGEVKQKGNPPRD
jgi:hypothetical protein